MNLYRLGLLASAGAVVGFLAANVDTPATSSTTEATAGPQSRVKIAHEFVRIRVTDPEREVLKAANGQARVPTHPSPKEDSAVFGVAAKADPSTARASSRARSSTAAARSGVLPRVGRLLVGDGRHRPEPFPRPEE